MLGEVVVHSFAFVKVGDWRKIKEWDRSQTTEPLDGRGAQA